MINRWLAALAVVLAGSCGRDAPPATHDVDPRPIASALTSPDVRSVVRVAVLNRVCDAVLVTEPLTSAGARDLAGRFADACRRTDATPADLVGINLYLFYQYGAACRDWARVEDTCDVHVRVIFPGGERTVLKPTGNLAGDL